MLVRRAEQLRDNAFEHEEDEPERAAQMYLEADSLAAQAAARDEKWAEPVTLRGWLSYDLSYLTGSRREQIERREAAVQFASEAIERDPGYADAHHLRGRVRYRLFLMDVSPDERVQSQLLDSAQADLEKATELDNSLAEAWYALSNLDYSLDDNVGAVLAAQRAYEADRFMDHMDDNIAQLYGTHYDLEQFSDADKWCTEGARLFPYEFRFTECQLFLMITPSAEPDVNRAWRLAREVDSLARDANNELAGLRARMWVAGVLAKAGMTDSAHAVIDATEAGPDVDPDLQLVSDEAVIRIMLKEYDTAIDLLRRYNAANPGHELSGEHDMHWWWRPLRDQPRFSEVTAPGH